MTQDAAGQKPSGRRRRRTLPRVADVFLLGVGTTSFGRFRRPGSLLAREAVAAAIADAGLGTRDLKSLVIATARGPSGTLPAQLLQVDGPLDASPQVGEAAAPALQAAWRSIADQGQDLVLCVGVHAPAAVNGNDPELDAEASAAQRYMHASGATEEDFARVVAKNRAQGAANPRAMLRSPVAPADVLASELLAPPLRRLMVAPPAEGAAAVVLGSSRVRPRAGARAPRVRAAVRVRDAGTGMSRSSRAALLAYQQGGVSPEDVDCAEVDDHTAAIELEAYELLQFASAGQGPELLDSGFTALGGVLPVNPSGGTLARGDAPNATELAQLCELTWQLRGEAGRRQVAGARVGLALSGSARPGAAVTVTVLSVR
jgi:acetyl-CoA acetyltransferase